MDFVALVVGIAALVVSVYAILDVRDQVRTMVALQRNLLWAKLLRNMVWRFVDPTEETREFGISNEMHEFTMLVRALRPDKTLNEVQGYANNEVLTHARDLVARGLATWKPNMDENVILEMVRSWQNEKNTELIKSMFKAKPWWKFGFGKDSGPI
jgi:hypothetical protein